MFDTTLKPFYADYLDEVMLRSGDNYDPYDYVEEQDVAVSCDEEQLEEFDWSDEQ